RGGAAPAGARRGGALRQAREAPLPPRDEAPSLPTGQGSRPVHVARGSSAPAPRRPCRGGPAGVKVTGRVPPPPPRRAHGAPTLREEPVRPTRSRGSSTAKAFTRSGGSSPRRGR